jgi:hypothetical protein
MDLAAPAVGHHAPGLRVDREKRGVAPVRVVNDGSPGDDAARVYGEKVFGMVIPMGGVITGVSEFGANTPKVPQRTAELVLDRLRFSASSTLHLFDYLRTGKRFYKQNDGACSSSLAS